MSKAINLIFPHQLFAKSSLLTNGHPIWLVEEYLFFKQYRFHKQKIAFHRATMKNYAAYLKGKKLVVHYIDSSDPLSKIEKFVTKLADGEIDAIHYIDPVDDWLERNLKKAAGKIELYRFESPMFLNTSKELSTYFRADKKSFFQTSFYKDQRKKRQILIDSDGNPEGGKWTYDTENRKKYPKGKTPPAIQFPGRSAVWDEAVEYVEKHFSNNPGELTKDRIYPITFVETRDWLSQFLEYRFYDFGIYEDAIVAGETFLHHSILTPMLNVGLIEPRTILDEGLAFAKTADIPINSTEGFVRQIIGWREFMRGMYLCKGGEMRTRNFWGFDRAIPDSFYTGTTGIDPVDTTIQKVLKTGYCHHIERLMVLGNFMLLCEFNPDEVYRWFMELFIDAYDWVMVPNVYGMSQFADGGSFATKPYIGGSNYIGKMSHFPKGEWEEVWDGLFWRFMGTHGDFFKENPRTKMLYSVYKRMPDEKRKAHYATAEDFLKKLDSESEKKK